ncbi:MAG: DsrE family protein [Bacteroidales bacterium]|nr:MAG: DsrE family protein [Bacteroidales bacterium]
MMKQKVLIFTVLVILALTAASHVKAQTGDNLQTRDTLKIPGNEKLVILWTSGDRDVALKMVFMYTYNAKKYKWWDDLTLLVWGPSAKLLSEDKELQDYIVKLIESGVAVEACKGCADMYGVSGKLEELGVNVYYTGKVLTDYIKEGRNILSL